MLVSIVMAYHDRRKHLNLTLRSINETTHSHLEVIVVDDTPHETLDGIHQECRFPVEVYKVDRNAFGPNPCKKFNEGFRHSKGGIIIIQNPENLHCGDIVSEAVASVSKNKYVLFSCRQLPSSECLKISDIQQTRNNILSTVCPNGDIGIFVKRRSDLHWCSAITRHDLADLNGFDERFANGPDFDDDEFYMRVKRKRMQIVKLSEDKPFVFHQEHPRADFGDGYMRNKRLFERVRREKSYRANNTKRILL